MQKVIFKFVMLFAGVIATGVAWANGKSAKISNSNGWSIELPACWDSWGEQDEDVATTWRFHSRATDKCGKDRATSTVEIEFIPESTSEPSFYYKEAISSYQRQKAAWEERSIVMNGKKQKALVRLGSEGKTASWLISDRCRGRTYSIFLIAPFESENLKAHALKGEVLGVLNSFKCPK